MKILLTGFEAFGDVEENPTQVIVEHLAKSNNLPNHVKLICEILPVEYEASGRCIRELIETHKPDAVIMTGVAASRQKINVEFWARNHRTAKIPDNSGVLLQDQPVNPAFPIEHFLPSTLPVFSIYSYLNNQGIPVERSNNAGGYICNNVFYCAVEYLAKTGQDNVLAGFVHIPTFEAISKTDMLRAYHMILDKVASTKPMKNLDAHLYMNPTVERELQSLFDKLPDNPSFCSLVSVDGYLFGSVGKQVDTDKLTNMVITTDRLAERVASETLHKVFDCTVMCGEQGTFFVLTLSDNYILVINWDDATSLSTPYMTSKLFPQALQPLLKSLD